MIGGIRVKDSGGEIHEFRGARSFSWPSPHGTTTVSVYEGDNSTGNLLGVFVNPRWVKGFEQ